MFFVCSFLVSGLFYWCPRSPWMNQWLGFLPNNALMGWSHIQITYSVLLVTHLLNLVVVYVLSVMNPPLLSSFLDTLYWWHFNIHLFNGSWFFFLFNTCFPAQHVRFSCFLSFRSLLSFSLHILNRRGPSFPIFHLRIHPRYRNRGSNRERYELQTGGCPWHYGFDCPHLTNNYDPLA